MSHYCRYIFFEYRSTVARVYHRGSSSGLTKYKYLTYNICYTIQCRCVFLKRIFDGLISRAAFLQQFKRWIFCEFNFKKKKNIYILSIRKTSPYGVYFHYCLRTNPCEHWCPSTYKQIRNSSQHGRLCSSIYDWVN